MTNEEMQALVNKAAKIINSGIIIPRGATNGDVFKTIFSNLRICENRDNKDYPYVEVFIGEHDSTCYPKEWWNAPYREGDNDAEH